MQGALGIGADLNRWNQQDLQTANRLVAEYKSIRLTVQQGLLYRLISPREDHEYSATQSVSSDGRQAVVFAFLHSSSMLNPYPRIHLKGLDPQGRYRLRVLAGKPGEDTPVEASGAYWMSEGIQLMLKGDFQGAAVVLDRVAQ
jgi:alpha-galactosidase